jgi:hypothetical protein
MDESDAEKDEDDGYKKPAGPVVAYVGGVIGFAAVSTFVWYAISHKFWR